MWNVKYSVPKFSGALVAVCFPPTGPTQFEKFRMPWNLQPHIMIAVYHTSNIRKDLSVASLSHFQHAYGDTICKCTNFKFCLLPGWEGTFSLRYTVIEHLRLCDKTAFYVVKHYDVMNGSHSMAMRSDDQPCPGANAFPHSNMSSSYL